jgi:hypothetical protein
MFQYFSLTYTYPKLIASNTILLKYAWNNRRLKIALLLRKFFFILYIVNRHICLLLK